MFRELVMGSCGLLGIIGIIMVSTATFMLLKPQHLDDFRKSHMYLKLKDLSHLVVEAKRMKEFVEIFTVAENIKGYARAILSMGLYVILIAIIGLIGSIKGNYRIINLYGYCLIVALLVFIYTISTIKTLPSRVRSSIDQHIKALESAQNISGSLQDIFDVIHEKFKCCLVGKDVMPDCKFERICKSRIYSKLTIQKTLIQNTLIGISGLTCILILMAYYASREAQDEFGEDE